MDKQNAKKHKKLYQYIPQESDLTSANSFFCTTYSQKP